MHKNGKGINKLVPTTTTTATATAAVATVTHHILKLLAAYRNKISYSQLISSLFCQSTM